MAKHVTALPNLRIDHSLATPLHYQLYEEIRSAILAGQIGTNARLPSTRALARDLRISRNTVLDAYAQLLAEGYLEGQVGSGTYVSPTLPDAVLQLQARTSLPSTTPERSPSRRGALLAATPVSTSRDTGTLRPFRPGLPTFETFPFDTWSRLMARHWRQPPSELLGYANARGYPPLREVLAEYLVASRGVRCTPEQIIIVAGSQQGLDLATRVLLDIGDTAWIEDPGYMGARGALTSAGAQIVPVPVDHEGLDVATGISACPAARLVYITPSHQFPLGVTMSLPRRLALLEWAHRTGAWILEDDYDSEYRYTGRPLPALQGLDAENRTVYLGTLSKTLFPSLRLGYMVVPPDLVAPFAAAKALVDRHAPSVEQAVLADFIGEGHFARHIRRTRMLYAERQATLVAAAEHELGGLLEVEPAEAGMHLVGRLPRGIDDLAVSLKANEHGIEAPALSSYGLSAERPRGLMLGYAAFSQAQIYEGVRQLKRVLQASLAEA
jgi:GntR family transcriptional regulator / MocR family aminotransferase